MRPEQFGARYERIIYGKVQIMESVLDFAEEKKENGLPRYDVEFIEPTESSVRFRIKDGARACTIPEIYTQCLQELQLHAEYATRNNTRLGQDESGLYIEFDFK